MNFHAIHIILHYGVYSEAECFRIGGNSIRNINQNVYIDTHWVAQEYLRRCQAGSWKKENTAESLKCWNLERILDERVRNAAPGNEITLEELVAEAETEAIVVDDD